ncbi:hypothetical protein MchiMG62_17160 [Methanoculleus chikugoensis]|uniref:Uncharacterized protein n=1 Tax=Methanoculleus chikugoensis TaxID=118126 RepID=A0ABN5XK37_9EURY|nr:hypothetical protein MchiMG62_17160 [Methanoculleus chikugoensis]
MPGGRRPVPFGTGARGYRKRPFPSGSRARDDRAALSGLQMVLPAPRIGTTMLNYMQ